MRKNKNFTEGSIIRSLFLLSVPIIFANIFQTAYQLTDTFWVGRLGVVAVAAVSISFPIVFLIISFGGGLAAAGTILVAQYKGRENKKMIDHISSQTMSSMIVISIVLSIIGYFLSPAIVHLMGAKPDVLLGATSYMRISFIGMVFMFIYMIYASLMRGIGEVKLPMIIVLGAVLLNLVTDPIFIFGYGPIPAFGVAGAAVSTVVTQSLAAIMALVLLIRGRQNIKIYLSDFKPDFSLLKRMFKLGFPVSIEQSTRALGLSLMTLLVASFGTLALAAYGIGARILSFIIIPALGISMATSTLVGQNIGAGKIKRAEKVAKQSAISAFIILTIVGILLFIFAKSISTFFIPGDIATIETSALFVRIMALTFGFVGIQMSLNGLFRGSGNTMISMILSLISLWVFRFPIAYFLSKHTSLAELGIWIAFPIANVITAIIAMILFFRGTWKRKKTIEKKDLQEETMEECIIEEGLD